MKASIREMRFCIAASHHSWSVYNSLHCLMGEKRENSHNSLISCPLACTETPKSPDLGRRRHLPLVKENFYQYQEHLKFVCILFSSTLNNFRSQITGVSDQSAPWLVLETQECYATLWYSTSIFQFNNHLTCTRTPGERRKEGEQEGGSIKKWIAANLCLPHLM